MSNPTLTIDIPKGGFVSAEKRIEELAESLLLRLSDRASARGLQKIRAAMRGANLGRLGFALAQTSDLKKSGKAFRRGDRVSASGTIFIRSRSPRTIGAIVSYTEGATISPRRGRYLWFPTDDLMRRARVPLPRTGGGRKAGNVRLEPHLWNRTGLDRSIGPLVFVRSRSGRPLLIVRNAPVNQATGKVKKRTKKGRLSKGSVEKDFIVAFVGIPNTVRGRRVNPQQAVAQAVAEARSLIGG